MIIVGRVLGYFTQKRKTKRSQADRNNEVGEKYLSLQMKSARKLHSEGQRYIIVHLTRKPLEVKKVN